MKRALFISTIIGFLASFEMSDMELLESKGFEIHYACNGSVFGNEEKKNNLLKRFPHFHNVPFSRNPFSFRNLKAYKEIKRIIAEGHFDVVHCHTPVGGILGRRAAKKCGVEKIIYSAHGFHFYHGAPLLNWLLFYPIEKKYSRITDTLITINHDDYDIASKKFHAKHTFYLHGVGINLEQFKKNDVDKESVRETKNLPTNKFIFISVGELTEDKNHILMLKAMKKLQNTDILYIICGKGALEKSYIKYIRKNKLEKNVKLLGYRKDVSELLSASDCFVFPSRMEGLSVALMEAIASKIPVICSKCRGNTDLITESELLFDNCSVDSLVSKINYIMNGGNTFVDENYHNLLAFDKKKVQNEMSNIYDNVLNRF